MPPKKYAGWSIFSVCMLLYTCQSPSPPSSSQEDIDSLGVNPQIDSLPNTHPFNPMDEVIGLSEKWTGDLDGMIERRRIRALVPYSQSVYYIDGPNRRGIAYESMVYFEEELNRQLGNKMKGYYTRVVFIPVTRDKLLPALLEGYGDIIPANLMVTDQRKGQVDFSIATLSGAREVVVSGPAADPLDSFDDLCGKTVYIRASSSFYEHIQHLNDSLRQVGKTPIHIKIAEEHFEDEEILEMVNAGLIPLTVVDEHLANLWSQILDSIHIHSDLPIHSGGELAWAMRKNSPQLKETVNAFIKKNGKGTELGNIIFNRYLKSSKYVTNALTKEELERFRACRDYFIEYGEEYQLDWLMLAAQGFQESRLNQKLRSQAGAIGVMQIKPSTANDPNVNIPNVQQMGDNIHAGTKYLRFLIDRYFVSPGIDSLNAGLFGIAAYNAGPARIAQLRKKAEAAGLNPDVWFDNVELIAAREIGRETVQYVSNIYKYYTSYRGLYLYMKETGKVPYEGW
ncbi:MAG: lytic transglycosylase F [Saprospirales bacterium]|nr:lytic transglycosylase F [Saprospirales bacterium]